MSTFRRRTRVLTCLAAVSAVGLLPACAASQDQAAAKGQAGSKEIDVAYSQPLNTLDPIRADQNQTNTIDDTVYDTLLAYDTDSKLVPSVAKEFTLAKDARSITLTLRDDVKFHDGSTLTADDVQYTLDRYKRVGQGIASALGVYKSTTIKDPTHLTINLTEPNSRFVSWLSKFYLLDKKLLTSNAGNDDGQTWLHSHDAGSGPFAIDQGKDPVKVTRFDKYWQYDASRPTAIVFKQIAESPTKRDELKAGNLDVALTLQAPDAKALETADGVKVDYLNVPNTAYMFMNAAQGPTANPVVRKALALAYNYSAGLSEIRAGKGKIENGPLPQTMSCLVDSPQFSQNLDQAKSLLQQAGISNLKLVLRFQPSITDMVRESTLFQSDLRKIGVDLQLQPIAFPDYLSSLSSVKTIPELTLVQDTAPSPDAGVYLAKSYDSQAIGTTNRAGYKNAKVDALLTQADATSDENARCELYKQIQTQINTDVPAIDMYTLSAPVAYRSDLTGIVASQTVYPVSLRGVRVG
ncbi:ABC transporter substrate-binding protein [Kribbella sp. NPDC059898]|uniref:ABC transporter substrate-binding protein n=1 Tax=Kribbella sp. NPDC059898 TaxID=3346995 RepID=UPI00364D65B2